MKKLWCDLRSDAERSDYILSGQAYDAGIIAHAIQADVAMAFHRCSEYDAEVCRLREENERLRKDAERYRFIRSIAHSESAYEKHNGNHLWFSVYDTDQKGFDAAVDRAVIERAAIVAARGGK